MTDKDTKSGPERHAPGPARELARDDAREGAKLADDGDPNVGDGKAIVAPLVIGTIRYGALVGAPIKAGLQADSAFSRNKLAVIVRDVITLAAAPVNDVIVADVCGWETVLDPFQCHLMHGACGAGATISFGDLSFPAALDAASSIAAAGESQLLSAVAPQNFFQPLWQSLGYASLAAAQAVSKQCTLIFQVGGAAATGSLAWGLYGYRKS